MEDGKVKYTLNLLSIPYRSYSNMTLTLDDFVDDDFQSLIGLILTTEGPSWMNR